ILAVMVLAAFPAVFATHSTPFNGSFSGSFTLTSSGTKATITGSGVREHTGEPSFAASSTITGPATCDRGAIATDQETFTPAHGDKVFTSSHDVLCPTSAATFQNS